MNDKVKELSEKLLGVINDDVHYKSAEQKIDCLRAYLCGLTDGIDYAFEHICNISELKIVGKPKIEPLLHTCMKCGKKTDDPVFVNNDSGSPISFRGAAYKQKVFCPDCAAELENNNTKNEATNAKGN